MKLEAQIQQWTLNFIQPQANVCKKQRYASAYWEKHGMQMKLNYEVTWYHALFDLNCIA
jgi:hypothetical protein